MTIMRSISQGSLISRLGEEIVFDFFWILNRQLLNKEIITCDRSNHCYSQNDEQDNCPSWETVIRIAESIDQFIVWVTFFTIIKIGAI